MNTQGQYASGPRASFSGGAGLLSTARDYARFLQMMLNDGSLGDARVLSPASVALMTSNHIGELMGPGTGFGLGFQVRLDLGAAGAPGSVGDYGWGGAYHTTYWVDPAQRMVVSTSPSCGAPGPSTITGSCGRWCTGRWPCRAMFNLANMRETNGVMPE